MSTPGGPCGGQVGWKKDIQPCHAGMAKMLFLGKKGRVLEEKGHLKDRSLKKKTPKKQLLKVAKIRINGCDSDVFFDKFYGNSIFILQ